MKSFFAKSKQEAVITSVNPVLQSPKKNLQPFALLPAPTYENTQGTSGTATI